MNDPNYEQLAEEYVAELELQQEYILHLEKEVKNLTEELEDLKEEKAQEERF